MIAEDKLNTLLENQELIIKKQEELSKKMDKMLEDLEKRFWEDVLSSLVANGFTIVGLEDILGNFKLFKGNNG